MDINEANYLFQILDYRSRMSGSEHRSKTRHERTSVYPSCSTRRSAVRFISAEPLLGPIDVPDCEWFGEGLIEWVICGGESGPNARPMHPAWARYLRDQCTFDGAAFFFKHHGGNGPHVSLNNFLKDDQWVSSGMAWPAEHMRRIGKKRAGRHLDGRTWEEMPA